jgi:plastocyanin
MTDIIGVLGEATATAVGTHTAYTVPTGKAAKCKLMYKGKLANTGTISIQVNGVKVMAPAAAAGAEFIFSSLDALYENTGATDATGVSNATTVGQAPQEFYLSAGDTVTYTVGVVALTEMNFQVVGSEIDVT